MKELTSPPGRRPVAKQSKLRVGCVDYLNSLPFYYGWQEDKENPVHFSKTSPAELNALMGEGKLDVSLISSLAYAKNPEKFVLLPNLCIGANNLSDSVLLISKFPIDRLEKKLIFLAAESLSSQVLLKILLRKLKVDASFESRKQNSQSLWDEADAFLLIGDEALFFDAPQGCYRYDLSQLWHDMTGLPFCFALWAARRESYETNPDQVTSFYKQLLIRFRYNQERMGTLVGKTCLNASSTREKLLLFDKCFDYLDNLVFKLDEPMRKGLLFYYQLAKECGEIKQSPQLEFIEIGDKRL